MNLKRKIAKFIFDLKKEINGEIIEINKIECLNFELILEYKKQIEYLINNIKKFIEYYNAMSRCFMIIFGIFIAMEIIILLLEGIVSENCKIVIESMLIPILITSLFYFCEQRALANNEIINSINRLNDIRINILSISDLPYDAVLLKNELLGKTEKIINISTSKYRMRYKIEKYN